jgi:hypothetical protein
MAKKFSSSLVILEALARDGESKTPRIPAGSMGSVRYHVFCLLIGVLNRSHELRSTAIANSDLDSLRVALATPGIRSLKLIKTILPLLHQAVGTLAILTQALDQLRDELSIADAVDWVRFQVDFCFAGNVRTIDGKITKREFLKEAAAAYEERFSGRLGDFKKYRLKITKVGSLQRDELERILAGLILSLRELDRDVSIHLLVIEEWLRRCDVPRATTRSIFRKEPPPVTGDGRTRKTAWFFPWARMQGEGIAMAHEFMNSRGRSYRLRKQALVEMDDEKVEEYWDTDAGRYWFRYRRDPWLESMREF